jgi:hypothetical protein
MSTGQISVSPFSHNHESSPGISKAQVIRLSAQLK